MIASRYVSRALFAPAQSSPAVNSPSPSTITTCGGKCVAAACALIACRSRSTVAASLSPACGTNHIGSALQYTIWSGTSGPPAATSLALRPARQADRLRRIIKRDDLQRIVRCQEPSQRRPDHIHQPPRRTRVEARDRPKARMLGRIEFLSELPHHPIGLPPDVVGMIAERDDPVVLHQHRAGAFAPGLLRVRLERIADRLRQRQPPGPSRGSTPPHPRALRGSVPPRATSR